MELIKKFLLCGCIVYLMTLCDLIVNANTVMVDSPFGKIQGAKKTDKITGQSYLSFKGIPYAKPPLGDLRFTKPQPHPKIVETFDATKDDKIICPHPDSATIGEKDFTEDCLILNIYTKSIDKANDSKKVLVFIHGGGFRLAFSTFHDPKSFVITQDVVVVTVNYRIGILGFLSLENEAALGNYGLWDQQLAIKWVKDNIRAFGGDPDDITIAGESAGAASVGLQIISPRNKGLFSKAYAQSGTGTSNFAISFNAQSHALSVAKSTGCWGKSIDDYINVKESTTVIDCLRNVPVAALTAFSGYSLIDVQFTPRVDGDFIPDLPAKLIVDEEYLDSIGFYERTYLTGFNNNEAVSSDGYLQSIKMVVSMDQGPSDEEKQTTLKSYLKRIENNHIKSRLGEAASSDKNASNAINRFYKRRFLDERAFVEMTTDVGYFLPSIDLLRAASKRKTCNSYLIYFNYFPNFMKGSHTGTPHGADLLFWFDMDTSNLEKLIHAGMQEDLNEEDLEVKKMFSSLIGEFIRSGNPEHALKDYISCSWPRYDVSNPRYLNFNDKPWIGSFLEKDKQDLWLHTVPNLMGTLDAENTNTQCGSNGVPFLAPSPYILVFFFGLFSIITSRFLF